MCRYIKKKKEHGSHRHRRLLSRRTRPINGALITLRDGGGQLNTHYRIARACVRVFGFMCVYEAIVVSLTERPPLPRHRFRLSFGHLLRLVWIIVRTCVYIPSPRVFLLMNTTERRHRRRRRLLSSVFFFVSTFFSFRSRRRERPYYIIIHTRSRLYMYTVRFFPFPLPL